MITSEQSRMARAALGWSLKLLAEKSGVAVATINRFETGGAVPIPATRRAIQAALEAAGMQFIPENGGGAGVRRRAPAAAAQLPEDR